jgi:hypothetical protein
MANFLKSLFVKGVEIDPAGATSDQVLKYNGTKFVPGTASTVGSIDDLSDVVVSSPLQFQGLMYDGTNWVNSNIPNTYLVRNNTGSTLLKGTLVGAVGTEPSGRIDVAPFEVTGTENSELRAMGIAVSNISDGVNGEVMSFGTLTGLDTRGSTASALAVGDETWAAGDILFAHPTVNGKLTNVRPQHDLAVAFITVVHASAGQIAIRIIPGNNHLEWMHDVSFVDKASGDFLKYNGTLWVNDVIDLGTDTTGNYIATISGTANEITVTGSGSESAAVTLSLPANVTISNNLVVTGDLTVSGNTVTLNTANLNVEDNFILLNSGVTSSPTLNAGLEVERGTSTNVAIRWNETSDKWEFTVDGTNYTELGAGGATISSSAPSSPTAGSLWFDSDTAQTYVYYDSAWIEIGASSPARLTISSSAPSNPIEGTLWFDSDDGATYTYYGNIWVEVGASAVDSLLNIIDAKGDLLVGTADNTIDNLTVGTNGYVLAANSSTTTGLEWVQVSSNPLTSNAAAIFIMDIGV